MTAVRSGLAMLLIVTSLPAAAFVRSTVPDTAICLYWDRRVIPWTPSADGNPELGFERTTQAIRASLQSWQDVGCSDVGFTEMTASSSRSVGWRRGEPADDLILFRTRRCVDEGGAPPGDPCWLESDCSNRYDCWSYADGVIALTTTSYNATTGELIDADIELNAATFYYTTADGPRCEPPDYEACVATDLQNTVTHEIGHVLGLAHSEDAEATMSANAPQGDVAKRTLADDDVDAICGMYPPGKPPVTCFEQFHLVPVDRSGTGCEGCSAGGAGSPVLVLVGYAGLRLLLRPRSGRGAGRARSAG